MEINGNGNRYFPYKFTSCDQKIGENINLLNCEVCNSSCVNTACIRLSIKFACGSVPGLFHDKHLEFISMNNVQID